MVAFHSTVYRNEAVTSRARWPVVEGESTHAVTWPLLHGNANNYEMVFKDDFMSNVIINKDIVPMQHLSRSKTCAKAESLLRYVGIWAWMS